MKLPQFKNEYIYYAVIAGIILGFFPEPYFTIITGFGLLIAIGLFIKSFK